MSGWAPPRRFWASVGVEATAAGFGVRLDERTLRTPAGAPLVVPTRALAAAIAAEWDAVGARVEPRALPLTRAANAAIDRIAPDPAPVAAEIAGWGAADLLCYRAASPAGLVARQAAAWDPPLAWAAETLGAPLRPTAGIVWIAQPESSLAALAAAVRAQSPFTLAALSEMVALSGSLVLALAALAGWEPADAIWERAHVDARWQADLWGWDAEAEAANALKRQAFLGAERFARLARG